MNDYPLLGSPSETGSKDCAQPHLDDGPRNVIG